MADRSRIPAWLEKWTSLICEFLELEQRCLYNELLAHPLGIYNSVTAEAGASVLRSEEIYIH